MYDIQGLPQVDTFPQGKKKAKLVELTDEEAEELASQGGTVLMDDDNVDEFRWHLTAPSPEYYQRWSLLEQNYKI